MRQQPVTGRGATRQVEGGADFGAFAAVAHAARVGATAQQQPQRAEQDRFAGTGFAGQRTHAGTELDFQLVDNGEVTNVQR